MDKTIVITELADTKRYLELAWQANTEDQALGMIAWLAQHGITAKVESMSYCKDWT